MSVQLRSRKLKSGEKSLYLDIHHNGERWREFLKIRLSSKDADRNEKKRLANKIRANRELEILSDETGHVPFHLKNQNFYLFAEHYINTYKLRACFEISRLFSPARTVRAGIASFCA